MLHPFGGKLTLHVYEGVLEVYKTTVFHSLFTTTCGRSLVWQEEKGLRGGKGKIVMACIYYEMQCHWNNNWFKY